MLNGYKAKKSVSSRKKIFFLCSRIPYPLEKGDKLRIYHQIRHLSKSHDVYLCVVSNQKLSDLAEDELSKICVKLFVYESKLSSILANLMVSLFSGIPFQVGFFFNSGADFFIKKVIAQVKPDHIFVQLLRMSEYVKDIRGIPKTLDYMDSFSMGMKRRKEKEKSLKKWLYHFENKSLERYEEYIFPYFDHHMIISEQDKQSLVFDAAQKIHVVPNGVDSEFFAADESIEKKYDIIFTGNMSYPPNVVAVELIAKEILPVIWKTKPDCNFLIAGADPSVVVAGLANDKITVTGWLDDIRSAYYEGRVCLTPLNIGTGLQNKILEAMSMGIPCITSELANNAVGAIADEQILIGRTPDDYAQHVLRLLDDPQERKRIGVAGKKHVVNNYHWESVVAKMESIMELNS
ncbi:MAG: sugar transferase (PEP-CTERM/EpsH1 system associated) [Saprospiraceae bacterium]